MVASGNRIPPLCHFLLGFGINFMLTVTKTNYSNQGDVFIFARFLKNLHRNMGFKQKKCNRHISISSDNQGLTLFEMLNNVDAKFYEAYPKVPEI